MGSSSRRFTGGNVFANGIRQHYLRFGTSGRPLLLVPGITSPAITWGFVAEVLADRFVVYVLDVRGRGLSEAGNHLEYGLDVCAADLIAFANEMGLQEPAILGHSMGARHAIRAASSMPGRFSRLALIDPPVSGPGRRPYPSKISWYVDSMRLARRGASVDELRRFTPTWTDSQIALRAEWLHTCDQAAVFASYAGFHEDDIHKDLPQIAAPILLMAAENGGVILDEDLKEIEGLAPDVRTTRVKGAGHMIPWDNLRDFISEVTGFLSF